MAGDQGPSSEAAASAEELQEAVRAFSGARKLTDKNLIGLAGRRSIKTGNGVPAFEMEMQRRLKDSVEALTGELVTFRQSSEAAAKKADAAAGKADTAARRLTVLTGWLIGFTVALVVLTVAVVILTTRLLMRG